MITIPNVNRDATPTARWHVQSRQTNADLHARVEHLANLLLLAGTAAASLDGSVTERDRLHSSMVTSALDEALGELRKLAVELLAE